MPGLQDLYFIVLTLAVYIAARRLYLRFPRPWLNIVIISCATLIILFLACGISYSEYRPARNIMTASLGPATVGLALPLYRYRRILQKYALSIVVSVAVGAFITMLLAAFAAKLAGLPWNIVISIMPKGVSIPFAVEIARMYDGIPALSATFVVATGTLGAPLGVWLLARARINDPTARGLALGTLSHAQGVALSIMENEQQGAMAGLAMILAGIFTAAFAPLAVWLLR